MTSIHFQSEVRKADNMIDKILNEKNPLMPSFVMRPHPQDIDDVFFFVDLVHETV